MDTIQISFNTGMLVEVLSEAINHEVIDITGVTELTDYLESPEPNTDIQWVIVDNQGNQGATALSEINFNINEGLKEALGTELYDFSVSMKDWICEDINQANEDHHDHHLDCYLFAEQPKKSSDHSLIGKIIDEKAFSVITTAQSVALEKAAIMGIIDWKAVATILEKSNAPDNLDRNNITWLYQLNSLSPIVQEMDFKGKLFDKIIDSPHKYTIRLDLNYVNKGEAKSKILVIDPLIKPPRRINQFGGFPPPF